MVTKTKPLYTYLAIGEFLVVMLILPSILNQQGWFLDQIARLSGIASSGVTRLTVTTDTCKDLTDALNTPLAAEKEKQTATHPTTKLNWPVICTSKEGQVQAKLLLGLGKRWLIEIETDEATVPPMKRRFLIPSDSVRLASYYLPRE